VWRIRNNAKLDQVINGADIVRFIKGKRVKWLGHIQIMDTSRTAERISEWKPIGRRSQGRPRLDGWTMCVCDDLNVLKVRNWNKLATDRKVWNDLSEKAKATKRCSADGRRRITLYLYVTDIGTIWLKQAVILHTVYAHICKSHVDG
jgi:hypothetical protein